MDTCIIMCAGSQKVEYCVCVCVYVCVCVCVICKLVSSACVTHMRITIFCILFTNIFVNSIVFVGTDYQALVTSPLSSPTTEI